MAAEDIDLKLTGIAKGVGVEFNDNNSRRQSNNFREQMKEKQRKRKEERMNGWYNGNNYISSRPGK